MRSSKSRVSSTRALSVAAAAVVGIGLTGVSAALPANAFATPTKTVVLNCAKKAEIKPGTLTLTCADGNAAISKIHWNSWNVDNATGIGTLHTNNCTPSCASGEIIDRTVRVDLHTPKNGEFTVATISHHAKNGRNVVENYQLVS